MAKVKTATRDTGSSVSGTLTLYHAEETYSGRPPVYALGVTAGVQSCGLAVAYWDNDAGVYKYDLSSLGVGGTWELTGEEYEEGKRVFVAWMRCWTQEQIAGEVGLSQMEVSRIAEDSNNLEALPNSLKLAAAYQDAAAAAPAEEATS